MGVPVVLSIAGSDSSGGAGIEADLKTFAALGVYGACVITALTAQNTKGVFAVHAVPADFVTAQLDAVFSDLDVAAVKIGMLGSTEAIAAVAAGLEQRRAINIVLDPVLAATSGEKLLPPDSLATLRLLAATADVLTPNIPEAATLLDRAPVRDEREMEAQARQLLKLGSRAVLIKGGHAGGSESADLLVEETACTRFSAPRLPGKNTHGTGCTLSSAIAAGLAKGLGLHAAVGEAKAYVTAAIAAADRLHVGSGAGPLHHFYKWW